MGRLLVIDDELGVCESIRYLFNKEHEIYSTSSFAEAVVVVSFQKFDVIILDLYLDTEKNDGLKVLKVIRFLDPSVAVIILTAYGRLESAQKAIRLGVEDYISKPFDLPYLQRRVAELMIVSNDRRLKKVESDRSIKEIGHLLSLVQSPAIGKDRAVQMSLLMIQAASFSAKKHQGFEKLNLTSMLSHISYILTGRDLPELEETMIVGSKLLLLKVFFRLIRSVVGEDKVLSIELKKGDMDVDCEIAGSEEGDVDSFSIEIIKAHEGRVSQSGSIFIRLPICFDVRG